MTSRACDYVVYIDEAGDTGLQRVRPIDPNGSSEWFILSGVVISADEEPNVQSWLHEIVGRVGSRQRTDIHFTALPHHRKAIAAAAVAELKLRCFVVCSNKKNMRKYRNVRPEQRMGVGDWFYCWLTRALLERVSHFVGQRSLRDYGEIRRVKIVYSARSGLRFGQMSAYYEWIRPQSANNTLTLPWDDIEWATISPSLLQVRNHAGNPGLQLADIVASAFFKACDKHQTGGCDPQFANLILPRIARVPDKTWGDMPGYGVKLFPSLSKAKLDDDQTEIFRTVGYPKQLWQEGREWKFKPRNVGAGSYDP